MLKKVWSIWAKTLGSKISDDDKTSDIAATIRTMMFLSVFLTNVGIVCGVVHHWDDNKAIHETRQQ